MSDIKTLEDVKSDTITQNKTKKPSLYKVLLLNDDFTPMDFVVDILKRIFSHNNDSANQIMIQVHQKGVGTAGIFTYEVAETKVYIVERNARKAKYPLKCIMEEDGSMEG